MNCRSMLLPCVAALRLAVLALTLLVNGVQSQEPFSPFEFALLGDPQIGYGQGGEYADAKRFGMVVDEINALNLPLSIVAGDLVQDRSLWQDWAFGRVVARLRGRVLLAAGNHDVVDISSLQAFRDRYGKDYYDVVHNNVAFVIVNSETMRDTRISAAEFELQWRFLAQSLAAHRLANRTHILLIMHRPPFVGNEIEPETEQNWPPATRARLMAMARESGVRWILAGHLHRTVALDLADDMHIVVGAGSARSFDRSPVAYHRFRVAREGLSYSFAAVSPPPGEPFSVPGLREWTPRLFDFSARHWLFTLFYAVAGAFALRTSRQLALRGSSVSTHSSKLWLAMAALLFAFSVNMQLDFDELIGELGRIAAKIAGVYSVRHFVTATAALVVGIGVIFVLARNYVRSKRTKSSAIALVLIAVPTAWFCLSMISNHHIGMLFNEGWWDLLILVSLVGIAFCANRTSQER